MTTQAMFRLVSLFSVLGLLSACGPSDGEGGNGTETAGGDATDGNLGENILVSGCGGFGAAGGTQSKLLAGDEDAVEDDSERCDEVLVWSWDEATETVSFVHTNLMLNCCGEHSLVVTKDAATGEFELAETDDPVRLDNGEFSRCLCMCRFDFKVNVPNVTGAIKVKLTLKVNPYGDLPDEPRKTLWEGELNLSAGSGSELNTAREGYECSP